MLKKRKNCGSIKAGGQSGQALVETAIIMPVMLLAGLGAFQLMLIQHARVMTEYAAYNATRAGIVHNADRNIMRNAALLSVLPLYGPTNDWESLSATYMRTRLIAEFTAGADALVDGGSSQMSDLLERLTGISANLGALAPDVSLVNVLIQNPTTNDFPEGTDEVDFDNVLDPEHIRKSVLVTETRVLYPLRIPVINRMIFNLWVLQQYLASPPEFDTSAIENAQFQSMIKSGGSKQSVDDYLADKEWASSGGHGGIVGQIRYQLELQFIRSLAQQGVYLLPIVVGHAMQMQSNVYYDNLRSPLVDVDTSIF